MHFRAVDTATLTAQPGSGATANKALLNFVNFDNRSARTLSVRVTLPRNGHYPGKRIGTANDYTSAVTSVGFGIVDGSLDLSETLGPGEAVQYILDKTVAPTLDRVLEGQTSDAEASRTDGSGTPTVSNVSGSQLLAVTYQNTDRVAVFVFQLPNLGPGGTFDAVSAEVGFDLCGELSTVLPALRPSTRPAGRGCRGLCVAHHARREGHGTPEAR